MMNKNVNLYVLRLVLAGLVASVATVAPADVYINEIFFNPPNPPLGEDSTREFIELRGTPNLSLGFSKAAPALSNRSSILAIQPTARTVRWDRTGFSRFVRRTVRIRLPR
jgi:hypothetical protein